MPRKFRTDAQGSAYGIQRLGRLVLLHEDELGEHHMVRGAGPKIGGQLGRPKKIAVNDDPAQPHLTTLHDITISRTKGLGGAADLAVTRAPMQQGRANQSGGIDRY